MLLKNADVFIEGKFERADVRISQDKISEIATVLEKKSGEELLDLSGKRLIPGLIDVHSHGCMGYDFSSASVEGMQIMCDYYVKNGVTSVLATSMTNEYELYRQAMKNIKMAMDQQKEEKVKKGARILGINMEGPYLGENKKGAHDAKYLLPITEETFEELDGLSGHAIRLVDLDPCLEGALDFIKKYQNTKKLSLAHTACDYALAKKAAKAGVTHVTHLFNAMNGLQHREPGIVGAVVDCGLNAELICDGIHIAPPVLRLMFRAVADQIVMISDSISATGMSDGEYVLGGQRVLVQEGKATLESGTIAGSTTNIYQAMQKVVEFGIPMEQAILSATYIPARAIGVEDTYGSIAVGQVADLLITGQNLELETVFLNGIKSF